MINENIVKFLESKFTEENNACHYVNKGGEHAYADSAHNVCLYCNEKNYGLRLVFNKRYIPDGMLNMLYDIGFIDNKSQQHDNLDPKKGQIVMPLRNDADSSLKYMVNIAITGIVSNFFNGKERI